MSRTPPVPLADVPELARAAWRTWGARGLGRRASYEAARRSGALRIAEQRWTDRSVDLAPLRRVGVAAPAGVVARSAEGGIRLYGGLELDSPVPPVWHVHPVTGRVLDADAHWTSFDDAAPEAGDIKDIWELSRFGWLQSTLVRWASSGDEDHAEAIWRVIEDWEARNPPYRGPHWMCGQETSLRSIAVMFLADALDASTRTTDRRRLLVAGLVRDAVGRVGPTLGYALSQRNNHATSEAGFLWTATVLAPWLPHADRLRRRAASALAEAAADQVAPDGSYAQHSPTYHRLALHVLLWCLAVERATGAALPDEVVAAVDRSVDHLGSLVAPGSDGQVPDLGGNDGALLFALAPTGIGDLRPVLAHAAAAAGRPGVVGPGPWDQEAAWFGLAPAPLGDRPATGPVAEGTHALTRGGTHAVLRAGRLDHRPAHADQMHVDVWLDGSRVAVDPGSYRYTAPAPWGNALAGEEVHNLPRVPGAPQAVRAGRFFWRAWREAAVVSRMATDDVVAVLARLDLGDGAVLRRLVVVGEDRVVVVDRGDGPSAEVRWNLPPGVAVEADVGHTVVRGVGWSARFAHEGRARVLVRDPEDPVSGWEAPTYGTLAPLTALVVERAPAGVAVAVFDRRGEAPARDAAASAAGALDITRLDPAALASLVSSAPR